MIDCLIACCVLTNTGQHHSTSSSFGYALNMLPSLSLQHEYVCPVCWRANPNILRLTLPHVASDSCQTHVMIIYIYLSPESSQACPSLGVLS